MSLQNVIDSQQINDCIKEYLIFNKFTNTKECFDAEIKAKQVSNKLTEKKQINFNSSNETIQTPKLYNLVLSEPIQKNQDFESKYKFETVHRKYLQILEAARQIFSSSINILEFLNKNQEVIYY